MLTKKATSSSKRETLGKSEKQGCLTMFIQKCVLQHFLQKNRKFLKKNQKFFEKNKEFCQMLQFFTKNERFLTNIKKFRKNCSFWDKKCGTFVKYLNFQIIRVPPHEKILKKGYFSVLRILDSGQNPEFPGSCP